MPTALTRHSPPPPAPSGLPPRGVPKQEAVAAVLVLVANKRGNFTWDNNGGGSGSLSNINGCPFSGRSSRSMTAGSDLLNSPSV